MLVIPADAGMTVFSYECKSYLFTVPKFKGFDKTIEVIIDGGYAKDTVLLPLGKLDNIVTITRLRRDAALFEVPPSRKPGQRGATKSTVLESNEAATVMNMLLYVMTELSTWDRSAEELVDRRNRPWDDADRRPSHEDRRNFLRHGMLANEFNTALSLEFMPKKIINVLERLLKLAA